MDQIPEPANDFLFTKFQIKSHVYMRKKTYHQLEFKAIRKGLVRMATSRFSQRMLGAIFSPGSSLDGPSQDDAVHFSLERRDRLILPVDLGPGK